MPGFLLKVRFGESLEKNVASVMSAVVQHTLQSDQGL